VCRVGVVDGYVISESICGEPLTCDALHTELSCVAIVVCLVGECVATLIDVSGTVTILDADVEVYRAYMVFSKFIM
jgi:hypothetical protein